MEVAIQIEFNQGIQFGGRFVHARRNGQLLVSDSAKPVSDTDTVQACRQRGGARHLEYASDPFRTAPPLERAQECPRGRILAVLGPDHGSVGVRRPVTALVYFPAEIGTVFIAA